MLTEKTNNSWGLRLGSGGKFVDYCQNKKPPIIGIGWKDVPHEIAMINNWTKLRNEVKKIYKDVYEWDNEHSISSATTQIFYFHSIMRIGDLVWYYNPRTGSLFLTKITSEAKFRNFDLDKSDIDIWHYREVEKAREFAVDQVPGDLYASIRHPKQTVWNMEWATEVSEEFWSEKRKLSLEKEKKDIESAYKSLLDLIVKNIKQLNENDWEKLIAEYFKVQGGKIIGAIGGSRPIIDVEAEFNIGLLPPVTWKAQVKRYNDKQKVDWPEIQSYLNYCRPGEYFVFVSVSGFTLEAKNESNNEKLQIPVYLLEPEDIARFILKYHDKISIEMKDKINLPF
jgi:predicted Mrr-cat superfamily restriction endonuclease